MNKIRKGKIIANISTFIGITLLLVSVISNWMYTVNIKNNLQGTEKFLNEMGAYKEPASKIAIIIGVIGVSIWIIGSIIGSFICKCPKCGYHIMTRFGSVADYCPKCGEKIPYKRIY